MNSKILCRISWPFLLGLFLFSASAPAASRVQIHADFTEAEATLAILDKRDAAQPVVDADWQALLRFIFWT